jgi:transcriptional regulator with XRE-family HTH domain
MATIITGTQAKMARYALNWTLDDIAERAGVGRITVHRLETESHTAQRHTQRAVRAAYERAGLIFSPCSVSYPVEWDLNV